MTNIAVLDYGIGNIRSICSAMEFIGVTPILTNDKDTLTKADGIVIPGVGAFDAGMTKLKEIDAVSFLQDVSQTNKPMLGICLGMQLLFDESDENGQFSGLGLVSGTVNKLGVNEGTRLPHIAWNEIAPPVGFDWEGSILKGLSSTEEMYFVHTYAARPAFEAHVLSVTEYGGGKFCSAVKKDNIYGCQFHPEKSAEKGLGILRNFEKVCLGDL